MEHEATLVIATIGVLLLLGLFAVYLGERLRIPHVTILILAGVGIGPVGLNLLPAQSSQWYTLISETALLMIGFILGGKLSKANIKRYGTQVLCISAFEVLGVALLVFLGLYALGASLPLALIIAGIAPASAPAAVTQVVHEAKAEGDFTETLLGIVAIDDAFGLIVFSILLAIAQMTQGGGRVDALVIGGKELGGAILLGVVLGFFGAYFTDRIRNEEPMRYEALGLVMLCGGTALYFEFSFLLAAMFMGAVLVNFAKRSEKPFEIVRTMDQPILILFFILAGAELHLDKLMQIGCIGGSYVLLRAFGLYGGAYLGGKISHAASSIRKLMGTAIMPQAGAAMGMALVAGNSFPELKETVISLVIGSTVIFELVGPLFTRFALRKAGDIPSRSKE